MADGYLDHAARAQLSDPDSNPAQVAASFLVQDTTTGATVISGDAAGTVGSGGWLSFPIYVTDGHSYTWKVRGHYNNGYGDVYGDFTQPESFYVDGQPPSVPSITSSDVRVNDWITASTPTSAGFSFSATDNSGINDYLVSRDGQPAELSGPTYLWTQLSAGYHTLTVSARDVVGNVGRFQVFSFGIGSAPVGAARTWRNLLLKPASSSDKNAVRYRWRRPTPGAVFTDVPTANTTWVGSSYHPAGSAVPSWPQTAVTYTNSLPVYDTMVWNIAACLGSGFGGVIQVQACYTATNGGGDQCSLQTVQLDASPFGGSYATTAVGPGTLSLATGDLDVAAADASTPGWTDPLTFGRDSTTLRPGFTTDTPAAQKVLGPGWRASLPSGPTGLPQTWLALPAALPIAECTYAPATDGNYPGLASALDRYWVLVTDTQVQPQIINVKDDLSGWPPPPSA